MSKRIGTPFETQTVRYLQSRGFRWAERRPLSGAADRGDILVCPGVIVECKAGKAAMSASDGQIEKWLGETERERVNANAELALLVTKRSGIGANRMGEQWCHMDLGVLSDLVYKRTDGGEQFEPIGIPVRTHLALVVDLLLDAGYAGTPGG